MGFFSSASWQSSETRSPTIPKCGACGLHKGCISPRMEVTGKGKRRILFVAEAPGEEEDRQGIQLVGKSGKKLRRVLRGLGMDLEDGLKTNSIICRPPENKMEPSFVDHCRANLLKTIRETKPRVIVLLGKAALDSLIAPLWKKEIGPLSQWVGWTIPLAEHQAWVCPTYHPSFLLRSDEDPVLERMFENHLEQALGKEEDDREFFTTEQLQDRVEVIQQEQAIVAKLRDLLRWKGVLAFDYETNLLKPDRPEREIVSCSFCLGGEETFAFPLIGERVPRLLSRVLRSDSTGKIASNFKFEERWTLARFGHRVSNWVWDTMLSAHHLDNRSRITSVKFQAFVLLGIPDYSSHIHQYLTTETANEMNRIRDLDTRDLLIYNGMDSLLEYKVAEIQREQAGFPWL